MFWGSYSSGYEEFCLLEYNAMWSAESTDFLEEHTTSIFQVKEYGFACYLLG
jgi:hypothetical protein